MALKAVSARKQIKKSVPKIEADIYLNIPAGDLLVYAAYYAGAENNAVSFEDALSASFLLFPKRFALKQLAKWPDSAMVGRRLGECKAKGLLKGNHDIGYTLTFKGARLAEKAAVLLGLAPKKKKVLKKKPVVVVKPAPVVKKAVVKKKTVTAVAPEKPVAKKIKAAAPVVKKKSLKPKVKPAVIKTVQANKKVTAKSGDFTALPQPPKKSVKKVSKPIKPVAAKKVKKTVVPKAGEPALKKSVVVEEIKSQPVVKQDAPKPEKKKPQPKKKPIVQQLSLPLSKTAEPAEIKVVKQEIIQAKKAPEVKPSKKKIEKQARPIWSEPASPPPPTVVVSAELKARAAKFIKSMERSDAYLLFKKNGADAKISEFDFRSMLLCTMESSPETLVKNTALFREYAGIQKRQDLILFLEYCSARFAPLFVPEKKRKK